MVGATLCGVIARDIGATGTSGATWTGGRPTNGWAIFGPKPGMSLEVLRPGRVGLVVWC